MSYADEVQAVSIDEALIDVTQRVAELEQAPPELNERSDVAQDFAKLLAEDIRADMREATDCEGENQVYSRQCLYADTLNSNSQHRRSRQHPAGEARDSACKTGGILSPHTRPGRKLHGASGRRRTSQFRLRNQEENRVDLWNHLVRRIDQEDERGPASLSGREERPDTVQFCPCYRPSSVDPASREAVRLGRSQRESINSCLLVDS